MNIPRLEDLVDGVRARFTDPQRQALAVQLATDLATLHALELAGADVGRERAHIRAQASSLLASEAAILIDVFVHWIGAVAGAFARGALTAAAGGR